MFPILIHPQKVPLEVGVNNLVTLDPMPTFYHFHCKTRHSGKLNCSDFAVHFLCRKITKGRKITYFTLNVSYFFLSMSVLLLSKLFFTLSCWQKYWERKNRKNVRLWLTSYTHTITLYMLNSYTYKQLWSHYFKWTHLSLPISVTQRKIYVKQKRFKF